MLKSIVISSLLGIYDYHFELNPTEDFCRFITGPNGCGKSTILNLLYLLYTNNTDDVSSIKFKSLVLMYEDGRKIVVEQKDILEDENSDEKVVDIKIDYKNSNSFRNDEFFSKHPIYIYEGRNPLSSFDIENCSKIMSKLLEDDTHGGIENFDDRLNLFKEIIKRYQFANKNMIVDNSGIRFIVGNNELRLDELSSGEQRILFQTFELLFVVSDNCLVLIDDPEYSLHLAWQIDYLKNLEKIHELRKELQFIIATHSPQILDSRWSLTNDLFEQTYEKF